ncbi:MAG: hypothetical protein FJ110_14270 [Deltaproteobacteria bacterium]|nr:hypothetical protein [Deltaproteobacteria bacterium]
MADGFIIKVLFASPKQGPVPHPPIVRIYRFEKNKPRNLVGLVEEVGKKGKKGFHTYDELWEILNSPIPPSSSLYNEKRKLRGHMLENRRGKRR